MVADRSLDGTGVPTDLVDKDIIEIFLGKSLFYEWKKVFKGISDHHSQMCHWLEHHFKAKGDIDVWGIKKKSGEISDVEMGSELDKDSEKEARHLKKEKKKGRLADSSKVERKKVKDDTGVKKKDKHRKKDSQR